MVLNRTAPEQTIVAPFAGAWIEILIRTNKPLILASLPSRERGLKLYDGTIESAGGYVAPFAGAWIEINDIKGLSCLIIVAPFAGAWIEINIFDNFSLICNSRSLRGSVD